MSERAMSRLQQAAMELVESARPRASHVTVDGYCVPFREFTRLAVELERELDEQGIRESRMDQ